MSGKLNNESLFLLQFPKIKNAVVGAVTYVASCKTGHNMSWAKQLKVRVWRQVQTETRQWRPLQCVYGDRYRQRHDTADYYSACIGTGTDSADHYSACLETGTDRDTIVETTTVRVWRQVQTETRHCRPLQCMYGDRYRQCRPLQCVYVDRYRQCRPLQCVYGNRYRQCRPLQCVYGDRYRQCRPLQCVYGDRYRQCRPLQCVYGDRYTQRHDTVDQYSACMWTGTDSADHYSACIGTGTQRDTTLQTELAGFETFIYWCGRL
jgi:hypothetical protein